MVAFHKTPTTPDIQEGVETAIEAVVKQARLPSGHVDSVKIGTTVRFEVLLLDSIIYLELPSVSPRLRTIIRKFVLYNTRSRATDKKWKPRGPKRNHMFEISLRRNCVSWVVKTLY